MAVLFIDGFDKYGPVGQTTPTSTALMLGGEWTSQQNNNPVIVAGLSATGQAVSLTNSIINKTLPSNATRIIGGVRFNAGLAGANTGINLMETASAQFGIRFNTNGTIALANTVNGGTNIASSTATYAANSTHYLEWDVTIGTASPYNIYVDGVLILSGTGNTRNGTTNNYVNAFQLYCTNATIFDDLYLFDTTGTTCNAVLLNSPIIETAFPSGDTATKQWTNGAAIIGVDNSAISTSTNQMQSNRLHLRAFTAAANMTLNSISFVPSGTNGSANFRAVVYTGTAAGASLLASGPTTTGCTNGTVLTLPLTTPLALTGGTSYAIGSMTDSSISFFQSDGGAAFVYAGVTFTSGAPSTLPTVTTGQVNWQVWGNCTNSASDYVSLNPNPAADDLSYIWSSTVGQEELMSMTTLANNPASVAVVAYKARVRKTDAGSRTVEVHCSSGGSDSAGSTSGGVSPGTTYSWIGNYLVNDPNTGSAWTGSAINSATAGPKVYS